VGAAAVVPVVLAGCGESGDITMIRGEGTPATTAPPLAAPAESGATGGHRSAVTLAALHSAGERTTQATSGRFQLTMSAGEGDPFMTASGEFGGGRAHQTMEMSLAGLGSMFGVEGEDADLLSGFGAETVVDGNTAYIKSSMMAEMAGVLGTDDVSADSWYQVDGGDLGAGDDPLADVGSIYGSETARLLSGAYGEVTTVGTEEVRGVTTTHSQVTIDPSKVVGTAAGLERDLGEVEFVADVWIGDDGLLHRLRFETDASQLDLPTGDGPSMVLDFEMWDIDTDIDVALPDPADVVDSSDLFGGR